MDVLRPGHAHRSSSDRLLNNYLDSQKHLTTSLLTLLSHSHSSTSSLLAYVTSSPGVHLPIRKSVKHAGFEGPLSSGLTEGGSQRGSVIGDTGTPGWASYIASLEQFRKDLKQIHLLEEELSRVKRDREILVTRLIKSTKSRPSKSDLSAIASTYSGRPDGSSMSSRASTFSITSEGSVSGKEGKRATKLAEAQAELLGCEEHLRSLEVRIESERNRVMSRGLGEKFRAMETVGHMWVAQARRGLEDLEKGHDSNAFELDSNGSIAPSQSASQIGFDETSSPSRGVPFPKHMNNRGHGHGSITGSIAEEDEDNSSGDDVPGQKLVVHENRPGQAKTNGTKSANGTKASHAHKPSPLGVPSVNSRARPLSSTYGESTFGKNDSDSDSDAPRNSRPRRAASDVGAMGYRPPTGRTPLRRTFSNDTPAALQRSNSNNSSVQGQKKKKGFFASISKFFKGPKSRREGSIRSGRGSPPYGASSKVGGPWSTRTDSNIKRASSFGMRRSGNDSSSDDDYRGNLISVTNQRNSTWSVDNVGKTNTSGKRQSLPVASGLIPAPRPTRSDLGAGSRMGSQSTITARNRPTSPTPSGTKTPTLGRSNTVKSTASTGTDTKRIRKNGSISRAQIGTQQASQGRNIMSLVNAPPAAMPDVPKAPKSQVTPSMSLPKAPGSSIVPAGSMSIPRRNSTSANSDAGPLPSESVSRPNSVRALPRSTTPSLPPSKSLQPPLKSAMRPTSPSPSSAPMLSPPLDFPTTLFSVAAPGPVQLPKEEIKPKPIAPTVNKRHSYQSTTGDEASIYESAMEDGAGNDESSSEEEGDLEEKYKVVENEKVALAGHNSGPPAKLSPHAQRAPSIVESEASDNTATGGATVTAPSEVGSRVSRRKSVRMNIPDSPTNETFTAKAPEPLTSSGINSAPAQDRDPSPPPTRTTDAQWSTRIGRMRDDTSEEEDRDEGYDKARKGLSKNTGKWEAVKTAVAGDKKTKKASKAGSSKGSTKGSAKGSTRG